MKKEKGYTETKFSAEVISEALMLVQELERRLKKSVTLEHRILIVDHDDSRWHHDTLQEFLADYRKYDGLAMLEVRVPDINLHFFYSSRHTSVSVTAPSRADIEAVFDVFAKHLKESTLSPIPKPDMAKAKPVVFIGHGKSPDWRDLKDHLQDKHGVKVEAYETGARAGHAIRDILTELLSKSSFAVLVLTSEDEQADGSHRARQNVIHETGLFQGRIGFNRAIVLLEEGAEELSNLHGIQHIRFSKGNIKETFGEVVATLRREFGNQA